MHQHALQWHYERPADFKQNGKIGTQEMGHSSISCYHDQHPSHLEPIPQLSGIHWQRYTIIGRHISPAAENAESTAMFCFSDASSTRQRFPVPLAEMTTPVFGQILTYESTFQQHPKYSSWILNKVIEIPFVKASIFVSWKTNPQYLIRS